MESRLPDYLRLLHSDAVSPQVCARLLQHLGSIAALGEATDAALLAEGLLEYQVDALRRVLQGKHADPGVEAAIRWQDHRSQHIVCFEDAAYPPLLREIDVPPPLLFVRGDVAVLSRPQVAIVGSRKASSYGGRTAFWLARGLSDAGLVVTSGLARGIDTRAHEGALAAEAATVAVIGTGVDRVYPPGNLALAATIAERGALVSEFPLGTPPIPLNFPRRNRIMSGMSLGTVVVEAALKSGSLITARLAMEQNREVFAVPGPVTSPNSAGCHRLLRDGARLVESPGDILEELGYAPPPGQATASASAVAANTGQPATIATASHGLVDLIGVQGCELQWLLDKTGLACQDLLEQLLQLELAGKLESRGGRYYGVSEYGGGR